MSNLSSLLNIARDGLLAQTAAMAVTGQNVSNASTPGYSQLSVNLQTAGDTFGGGVVAGNPIRSTDMFAFGSVLTEQSKEGAAGAESDALQEVQTTLAPASGGISDDINAFFAAYSTLSTNPADPSARTAALASATTLAQGISSTAAGLDQARSQILTQAQGVATQVNGELSQIAQLNSQIVGSNAQGSPATSLEDQRDQLVSQVSVQTGAQVTQDSQGNYTLFAAGTALVSGNSAASLSVGLDANGNMQFTATQSDGTTLDVTSNIDSASGTLGGLCAASNTDIATTQSNLDQFAYNFATAVNAIQSSGYGTDGSTGNNLFTQPTTVAGAAYSMAVNPAVASNSNMLATSSTAADVPGGNGAASAMANLASQPLGSASSPANAFGAIVATLGDAASAASSEETLRTQTVAQATALQQSATGVSLDEQMTSLTQYQNAYGACSQVLQTANSLLQDMMTDLGGSL